MSERTLVRRLADEGVTFSEILQQLKASLAIRYLEEEHIAPPAGMSAWLLLLTAEIGHVPQISCSHRAMLCLVVSICTDAPPWQKSRANRGRTAANKTCHFGDVGIRFSCRSPKVG